MNRGVKTAKARAKVIAGRHPLNPASFYAAAGCLTCHLECQWPSFSPTTPHQDLPLGCLERVLVGEPERCFYHLEGVCLADSHGDARPGDDPPCVVEPGFAAAFPGPDAVRRELAFRKRTSALVAEAKRYLAELRSGAASRDNPHPRMVRVARRLRELALRCAPCRYTPHNGLLDWDVVCEPIVAGRTPLPVVSPHE